MLHLFFLPRTTGSAVVVTSPQGVLQIQASRLFSSSADALVVDGAEAYVSIDSSEFAGWRGHAVRSSVHESNRGGAVGLIRLGFTAPVHRSAVRPERYTKSKRGSVFGLIRLAYTARTPHVHRTNTPSGYLRLQHVRPVVGVVRFAYTARTPQAATAHAASGWFDSFGVHRTYTPSGYLRLQHVRPVVGLVRFAYTARTPQAATARAARPTEVELTPPTGFNNPS